MQIVNHRGFVQVRQFSHIICLVELGRVDFVHLVRIDFPLLLGLLTTPLCHHWDEYSYLAIVTLHQQTISLQFLQHQSADERLLRVTQPNIFVARKVVRSLKSSDFICPPSHLLGFDKAWGKSPRCYIIARIRPFPIYGGRRQRRR